nr:MarR family transcriptional regulator [Kaistia hirudinis]
MQDAGPPSELSSHLGFWLRAVSNHVSHAFAAKLAGEGVTVAEWVMLRTLHGRDPMPPSRVAETMRMTRGAITRLAERLIGKGLVVRTADPRDGRAQTLSLTAEGVRLVPVLAALADRNDAEFFGPLSAGQRADLEALLRLLIERGGLSAMPTD